MKKIFWIIIVLVICAGAFQLYVNFMLNKNRPNELQKLIDETKESGSVLKKVGGYESYKISYDYKLREVQKDYPFEITIFFDKGYVDFKGTAHYLNNENKWIIVKNDTIIKNTNTD